MVKGPSIENISFSHAPRNVFDEKYWNRLNISLPNSKIDKHHWIVIKQATDQWVANPAHGEDIELPKI